MRIDDKLLTNLNSSNVSFNGWEKAPEHGVFSSTWDKINLDLDEYSGKKFTYAFAMLCANDVVYGEAQVPTPEPGTILLMGVGALGACFIRRRTRSVSM